MVLVGDGVWTICGFCWPAILCCSQSGATALFHGVHRLFACRASCFFPVVIFCSVRAGSATWPSLLLAWFEIRFGHPSLQHPALRLRARDTSVVCLVILCIFFVHSKRRLRTPFVPSTGCPETDDPQPQGAGVARTPARDCGEEGAGAPQARRRDGGGPPGEGETSASRIGYVLKIG